MERKYAQTMASLATQSKTSVVVSMVSNRLPTMSAMGEISFQFQEIIMRLVRLLFWILLQLVKKLTPIPSM